MEVWRPTLYHAPGRWATSDGCMPYALVWIYWREWQREQARDRYLGALAVNLGHRGEQKDFERAERAAYGRVHG